MRLGYPATQDVTSPLPGDLGDELYCSHTTQDRWNLNDTSHSI